MIKNIIYEAQHKKFLSLFYLSELEFASKTDGGIDLFLPTDIEVEPGQTKIIDLGIKFEFCMEDDESLKLLDYELHPKITISRTKLRLTDSVGKYNPNDRGNLTVKVHNTSQIQVQRLSKGDRLCELVFVKQREIYIKQLESEAAARSISSLVTSNAFFSLLTLFLR